VRRAAEQLCGQPNVPLIEVGYPELVFLLSRCHFVVTDPGGIQEEAPPFGKPVLVTRDTTERPEAMELGLAMLVGTDVWRLFDEMTRLLDDNRTYSRMSLVEIRMDAATQAVGPPIDWLPTPLKMRRRRSAEPPEKGKKSGDAVIPALLTPMKQRGPISPPII
jgi:hypothetical protein